MIPRFALFSYTTGHPHDDDCTGPTFAGRMLSFYWLGLVFEFSISRKQR